MTAIGTEPIAERARRALEPVVAREGYELVEVEWLREGPAWVLRLYVDREGGVGIQDCQELSRLVETILDVEDFIEPAYHLEVSSPGVNRPLRTPEHFERWKGHRAHVKTFAPVEGTAPGQGPRKNWTGTLRGFADGHVELEVDGALHRIPLAKIAKANLEYDFDADLRRKE